MRRTKLQRIAVVGSSGAGKTTVSAALARRLGLAHLELDGVHHLADWTPRPEVEALQQIGAFVQEHRRWVIDGNYARYRELVWAHADTIVWLDLPRPIVMRRLLWRTARRVLGRQELWNGNRESWSNLTSLDPSRSVLAWSWTRHQAYRDEYLALMLSNMSPREWIRLRSAAQVRRFLGEEQVRGVR